MIPHSRPWLTSADVDAVAGVVASGMLVGGAEAPAFANGLGAASSLGPFHLRSSGRAALADALISLRLPAGGGVVVQTYVCDAVIWAIMQAGLVAQFCDIGDGWTATPATVAPAVTETTVAILLAPPFGLLQSAAEFRPFGLPIVHDLCQASPSAAARVDPARLGDLVTFSFDPTKYICAGGGGAFVDRRPTSQAQAQTLGRGGETFGEMQAALGRAQLARVRDFFRRRSMLAELLRGAARSAAPAAANVDVESGNLFRYPLTAPDQFPAIADAFAAGGVTLRRGVDMLAHRAAGLPDERFPRARAAYANTCSPPFYPGLSDDEAEQVIRVVERCF